MMMNRPMKALHLAGAAALFLSCSCFAPSASAQEGWWFTGTTVEGMPYHTRTDYGQGTYRPTVVEYDVWPEGTSIGYKENFVGSYYVHVHKTKPGGGLDGESHDHKGEFASGVIRLPVPPAFLNAGEAFPMELSVSRNTDCGWSYDRLSAGLGVVYIQVNRRDLASFDTSTKSSMTCGFNAPRGTEGAQMPVAFHTLLAGKQQTVTYNYVWSSSNPVGTGGSGSTGGGDFDWGSIPDWAYWGGGILLLLLLFGRKKKR